MNGTGPLSLDLSTVDLTTDWQLVSAIIPCNMIELTADQVWWWATRNTDIGESNRRVPAWERYQLFCSAPAFRGAGRTRFQPGDPICYVKGQAAGLLWVKSER